MTVWSLTNTFIKKRKEKTHFGLYFTDYQSPHLCAFYQVQVGPNWRNLWLLNVELPLGQIAKDRRN